MDTNTLQCGHKGRRCVLKHYVSKQEKCWRYFGQSTTQKTKVGSKWCFPKLNQCLSESTKITLRGEKYAKVKETTKERIIPQWSHQFEMQFFHNCRQRKIRYI